MENIVWDFIKILRNVKNVDTIRILFITLPDHSLLSSISNFVYGLVYNYMQI